MSAAAQDHHGVTNLAHLIAIGVEDTDSGQTGKEYPGRSTCRHVRRLPSNT